MHQKNLVTALEWKGKKCVEGFFLWYDIRKWRNIIGFTQHQPDWTEHVNAISIHQSWYYTVKGFKKNTLCAVKNTLRSSSIRIKYCTKTQGMYEPLAISGGGIKELKFIYIYMRITNKNKTYNSVYFQFI